MFVERIQQSIREAPEEKQESNKANRIDGLLEGQFCRAGCLIVLRAKAPPFAELFEAHDKNLCKTLSVGYCCRSRISHSKYSC